MAKKYSTILADPPWFQQGGGKSKRGADKHYPLLKEGQIKNLMSDILDDVVEDDALIEAVKSGKVSGVGLDVFEWEPDFHSGYLDLPNAFLLPHIGSATKDTRDAMGFRALDNLDAVFAGEEPEDKLI